MIKRTLVLFLLIAAAAAAADFSGNWSGKADLTVNGEKQPATVSMSLKQEGDTLTGTAGQSKYEQAPIRNGKVDGSRLTFDLQPGDDAPVIQVVLTLEGETLRGTAKGKAGDVEVEAQLELTREK